MNKLPIEIIKYDILGYIFDIRDEIHLSMISKYFYGKISNKTAILMNYIKSIKLIYVNNKKYHIDLYETDVSLDQCYFNIGRIDLITENKNQRWFSPGVEMYLNIVRIVLMLGIPKINATSFDFILKYSCIGSYFNFKKYDIITCDTSEDDECNNPSLFIHDTHKFIKIGRTLTSYFSRINYIGKELFDRLVIIHDINFDSMEQKDNDYTIQINGFYIIICVDCIKDFKLAAKIGNTIELFNEEGKWKYCNCSISID